MKRSPLQGNRRLLGISVLLSTLALVSPLAYTQMMGPGMGGGMMGSGMGPGMMGAPQYNNPPQSALPRSHKAREFAQTCSGCHALPSPRQHTAAQWPQVVARMEQTMSAMGRPLPDRRTLHDILDYLESHAAGEH